MSRKHRISETTYLSYKREIDAISLRITDPDKRVSMVYANRAIPKLISLLTLKKEYENNTEGYLERASARAVRREQRRKALRGI